MNSIYSDYITVADTVLDGAVIKDPQQNEHRWCCAFANEDCTFELTSDTMFDSNGDPLGAELITLSQGSYYYLYANKITHKSGSATYYRQEAAQ